MWHFLSIESEQLVHQCQSLAILPQQTKLKQSLYVNYIIINNIYIPCVVQVNLCCGIFIVVIASIVTDTESDAPTFVKVCGLKPVIS